LKHNLEFIKKRLADIRKANLYRALVFSKVSGPYITIEGKKVLNLSSNDYLGLRHIKSKNRQIQSSSRLIAGNDVLFKRLETKLAQHKSKQASLIFPTGYMANLGMISILAQKNDLILSDELNHASIIDSCKLSQAKKSIYKHNDLSDLEKKLSKKASNKFVVTEGIFSMNGDLSRLDEISKICKKYGAFLILDDAHGDFVIGKDGKGTPEFFGVSKNVDVYISSLSKGLGAFGGYLASSKDIIDLAINTSRPFIYTSALPNILVEIALERFSARRKQNQRKLWENVYEFHKGLESLGYQIDSPSHIIPIIIGDERRTMNFAKFLLQNGVFAQPIRYPTVSRGTARIRVSITAWLSNSHILKAIDVFEKAGRRFDMT
jgi:glycine C-acetyltransferase